MASALFSPVTWTLSVCLPGVRPSSVMMGVADFVRPGKEVYPLARTPSTLTSATPLSSLRAPIHLTEVR
jgi:hypothetical protein